MRVCSLEFTNARALLEAEPPLPTCGTSSTWTRPGLKQLGCQADSRAAGVAQGWWGTRQLSPDAGDTTSGSSGTGGTVWSGRIAARSWR